MEKEAFLDWNAREYQAFVRGMCEHGKDNIPQITEIVKTAVNMSVNNQPKTEQDVELYHKVFWKKGPSMLRNWQKIEKKIMEAENNREQRERFQKILKKQVCLLCSVF